MDRGVRTPRFLDPLKPLRPIYCGSSSRSSPSLSPIHLHFSLTYFCMRLKEFVLWPWIGESGPPDFWTI